MTENVFTRVKSFMQLQNFSVNDSWLSECIEYFISSNSHATPEAVQKFVEEQFLLSDLRETNNINGCLPSNLDQQKNVTLPGKYTLQLLKVYDISVSKFKQLEKIRNVSIDNIEATREDKPQSWEPTSKRMLQLFLTDGIQEISAIEYKPIRKLNDGMYPGLKILIIGPVTCRRGIILLEETNFSIKGGEVDDLLIPNALENVLAKALNMPVNSDPYNDTNKHKKPEVPNDLEDDFNIDLEEIEMIERSETNSNQNPSIRSTITSNSNITSTFSNQNQQHRNPGPPINRVDVNEFPNDDDIFDDVNVDEIQSTNNYQKNNYKATPQSNLKINEPKPSISSNALEFPEDDFDLADVDFDMEESWNQPVEIPKPKEAANFRNDPGPRRINIQEEKTESKQSSNVKVSRPQSTPKNCKDNRKITDFIGNSVPREQLPPKICDYICDVITMTLTDRPIRKTVKGKLMSIGKLTKKNMLWALDGTIADQSGSLDVNFSSQFMEGILGLSVSEFSQQKKKIKSNVQMEEQLRKQMLDGQERLQAMDCLMELEMKSGAKPVVMSYSELSQDQKNSHDKRFRMLKSQKPNQ